MHIQLFLVLDTLKLNGHTISHFSTMFQYMYKVTELKKWLHTQVKYNLFSLEGEKRLVSDLFNDIFAIIFIVEYSIYCI